MASFWLKFFVAYFMTGTFFLMLFMTGHLKFEVHDKETRKGTVRQGYERIHFVMLPILAIHNILTNKNSNKKEKRR